LSPQIGCNCSQPLLQLLQSGQVDVDWIKLANPETLASDLRVARRLRPVLLHTLGRIGRRPADLANNGWAQLAEALQSAGSPHLAAHLYTTAGDWDELANGAPWRPELAPIAMQRFVANLRTARSRLAVPLLVENMPYNHPGMLPPLAGPEYVRQACDEAGVGLLLDAAHVRVSAVALGMEPRAYAAGLPLAQVREVHVSGPRWIDGRLCDRHNELGEEDWELVEWLLARTHPQVVTLEYGGTGAEQELAGRNDPEALLRQLQRLRSVVA
jgi:uncharacterized protein